MSTISDLITLGIGPGGDVITLLTGGLGMEEATPGTPIIELTARPYAFTLTAQAYAGMYSPALIVLEDGTGYLLTEDAVTGEFYRLMRELGDEGTPLTARPYSFTLTARQ